jgi:hypothetical protein
MGLVLKKNTAAKVVRFPVMDAQNIFENELGRKHQIVKRD